MSFLVALPQARFQNGFRSVPRPGNVEHVHHERQMRLAAGHAGAGDPAARVRGGVAGFRRRALHAMAGGYPSTVDQGEFAGIDPSLRVAIDDLSANRHVTISMEHRRQKPSGRRRWDPVPAQGRPARPPGEREAAPAPTERPRGALTELPPGAIAGDTAGRSGSATVRGELPRARSRSAAAGQDYTRTTRRASDRLLRLRHRQIREPVAAVRPQPQLVPYRDRRG